MRKQEYNIAYFFDKTKKSNFIKKCREYCIMAKTGAKVMEEKRKYTEWELIYVFALREYISLPFVRLQPFYDLYPKSSTERPDELIDAVFFEHSPYKHAQYDENKNIIILRRNREEVRKVLKAMYEILEVLIQDFQAAFKKGTLEGLEKEKKCYLGDDYYANPKQFITKYKKRLEEINIEHIKESYQLWMINEFKSKRFFDFFSTEMFFGKPLENVLFKEDLQIFKKSRRETAKMPEHLYFSFEQMYLQNTDIASFCSEIEKEVLSIMEAYKNNDKTILVDKLNAFFSKKYINKAYFNETSNKFVLTSTATRIDSVIKKLKETWDTHFT